MTTVSPQEPTPGPDFERETPGPDREPDFEREVYELVRDTAPRLFAVVAEYRVGTEDEDALVLAWGLAYEGGQTEAVLVGGGRRWRLASPEHVTRYFRPRPEGCSLRLVWLPRSEVDGVGREADAA
ncbi:hypothetical protein ACWF94_02150 [Streptomyces sp. NPDC055078]